MNKKKLQKIIANQKDLFKGAKKSTLIADVTKKLNEEHLRNPIDEVQFKRNRDWSILGSQVVGAEKY